MKISLKLFMILKMNVFILKDNFYDEEQLASYFNNEENLKHLREIIVKNDIIAVTVSKQTIFMDTQEFQNTLKYHTDILLNARNWKRCLNFLKFSQNSIPLIQFQEYFLDDVKNYILQFIKDNYERMKRTCKDMNETKGGLNGVIDKTAELIKLLLGFEKKADFNRFSNEFTHIGDFVNKFNNLSNEHFMSSKYQDINFFDYAEINFHLIFLMILGSSSRVKYWCSDKECKRLQTLLDSRNTSVTSTGFVDLFYLDFDENAYNIEFKYYRGNKLEFFRSKFENIEDCKILAYDQACSYQVLHNGPLRCYSVVFHFNNEQIVKKICCDLFPESNEAKNRPYYRAIVNLTNFEMNIQGDSQDALKIYFENADEKILIFSEIKKLLT
jgi:hypothetical protein